MLERGSRYYTNIERNAKRIEAKIAKKDPAKAVSFRNGLIDLLEKQSKSIEEYIEEHIR